MRKSLGDKRREIPVDRAQDILKILADFTMVPKCQSHSSPQRVSGSEIFLLNQTMSS